MERFRDTIRGLKETYRLQGTTEGHSTYWTKALISIIVRDDIAEVVGVISRALDQIELSLHDDDQLRNSATMKRDGLARWPLSASQSSSAISAVSSAGPRGKTSSRSARPRVGAARESRSRWIRLSILFWSAMRPGWCGTSSH